MGDALMVLAGMQGAVSARDQPSVLLLLASSSDAA